jgi:pyruvate dehydrogenase E1 component beta subunit
MDTPLAESGIVGFTIGMALNGLRPVAEIQFDGFTYPALDQLISHAAKYRNRTRGGYTVPMVLRFPCGGLVKALEHHSESPETYFCHTAGLKVVMPSRPYDAKGLLISAIRDPDPVIFMEPKRLYRSIKEDVPEEEYTIPIGKAQKITEGDQLTIISWGSMVQMCLKVLDEVDVSAELIDLRTLSPIDTKTIIDSVSKTGRALIVHEAPKTCGLGAEIAAIIAEKAILNLKAPVIRVTGYDTEIPLPKLEKYYYPSPDRIKKAIEKLVKF